MYWRNDAKRALRTYKNHFIAALCTVDPKSPFYLRDRLLNQFTITLEMLRRSRLNPGLSAYKEVDGIQIFEQTQLAPLGCKLKITKNIIRNSPTLPTQSMDGTLDH